MMHTFSFRFIRRWALFCVIVSVFAGIGLMVRHIETALARTTADGSEWATIPEMPSLPEPSLGDYPVVIGQTVFRSADSRKEITERLWGDRAASLIQWGEDEPSLVLSDRLSCTALASQDPMENPASNGLDFDALHTTRADTAPAGIEEYTPVACCEEEQEIVPWSSPEQPADGNDTISTSAPQKVSVLPRSTATKDEKEKGDAAGLSAAGKQAPIKVQTKIRCIETILKKAIIEPHLVNAQTEGLRITGLERISLAKKLLLQSGDIICAINRQPLTSKRRAYEIFKGARSQSNMRVDFLRDGETRVLLFEFR